jgi:glycosyltransferase involved in cell wall biosynthesis
LVIIQKLVKKERTMKIIAIALAKNEADIIGESVAEALSWVDEFVIYDNGSTDGTGILAQAAGAIVLPGSTEPFDEHLRQHTLNVAASYDPDWIVRIDIDEIYHHDPDPRAVLEEALSEDSFCVRALQMEFWLTLDDVRRGLALEDERVSVQRRRRWYTCGHMAMVAWRHRPDLAYYPVGIQNHRNVPLDPEGRDVSQIGPVHGQFLVQKHYNCRSLPQLMERMQDRIHDLRTFGKYRYNLVIDEQAAGLHYLGPDEEFCFKDNHEGVYGWYSDSDRMFKERREIFGWNH